jgi:hypothetical protein
MGVVVSGVPLVALLSAGVAHGQQTGLGFSGPQPAGPALVAPPPDAGDPALKDVREANARRYAAEKQLRAIRGKHFVTARKTEVRQAGILKLREFTDPVVFPSMLTIFENDGEDVRLAILDHFADQKTAEGDAALAWAAVYGKEKAYRQAAAGRLVKRVEAERPAKGAGQWTARAPRKVETVLAAGLEDRSPTVNAAAAGVVEALKLYEAIPMLIAAQVRPENAGEVESPNRSLGYILIGTQRSFVADLTPVTSEAAVGFDPTLGVITEGTILRVIDAFVYTYNVDVHNTLVRMTEGALGEPTAEFGWDNPRWVEWFETRMRPELARRAVEEAKAEAPNQTDTERAGKDAPGK